MNPQTKLSRKELLRSFFQPLKKETEDTDKNPCENEEKLVQNNCEPDCLASLPPEFSEAMLREEVARLGQNPDLLTVNEMARLVLLAMQKQKGNF